MPGWIGLNRGRVSTCSLTMGRVCKTCSARRSSAGPTLGSTGLLGSERDEKDYTFTCYIVIYIYFNTWKLVTALMYWCCLINDMKDFQLPTLLLFKHMILVQRSIHYIVNFLLIWHYGTSLLIQVTALIYWCCMINDMGYLQLLTLPNSFLSTDILWYPS